MSTETRLQSILTNSSTQSIKNKLAALDTAYHITEDSDTRRSILLAIDELKIELKNRGIKWKN